MVSFIWSVAILAILLQLIYDQHKVKAEQRRKERFISNFVDSCIANGTLYPVTPPGYGPDGALDNSTDRAAVELKIDCREAYYLMSAELKRRGLSVRRHS